MCWTSTAAWASSPSSPARGACWCALTPEAPAEDGVLLMAHLDTLGGMVAEICGNGRLRLTNLGGMDPNNAEAENVRVITRAGKVWSGTCQLKNASVHVNGDYSTTKRSWDTVEVVLDEEVYTKAEVEALGILPGDIVCFDPPHHRHTVGVYQKAAFWTISCPWPSCWARPSGWRKASPGSSAGCGTTSPCLKRVGHGGGVLGAPGG